MQHRRVHVVLAAACLSLLAGCGDRYAEAWVVNDSTQPVVVKASDLDSGYSVEVRVPAGESGRLFEVPSNGGIVFTVKDSSCAVLASKTMPGPSGGVVVRSGAPPTFDDRGFGDANIPDSLLSGVSGC